MQDGVCCSHSASINSNLSVRRLHTFLSQRLRLGVSTFGETNDLSDCVWILKVTSRQFPDFFACHFLTIQDESQLHVSCPTNASTTVHIVLYWRYFVAQTKASSGGVSFALSQHFHVADASSGLWISSDADTNFGSPSASSPSQTWESSILFHIRWVATKRIEIVDKQLHFINQWQSQACVVKC